MTLPVFEVGLRLLMAAAVATAAWLVGGGVGQADALRPVCFIGPVLLAGISDNACVGSEKERKRLSNLAVVDWDRKPAPLTMRAEGNAKDKVTVTTCRKWLRTVSLSRAAMRATDRGHEALYERTCLTLDQLKFGAPARKVFLAPQGKDLLRADRVPARLLEQAGIKGPLPLPGATVGGLSKAGELVIRDRKIGMMEVTWRSVDLALNPVARGDFDRDGIEDLAIAMEVVAGHSKRRATTIVFLTRQTRRGPLEVMYPKARR